MKKKFKVLAALTVTFIGMQIQIPLVTAHGVRTSGLVQVGQGWDALAIGDCQADVLAFNRDAKTKKGYFLPAGQTCGLQVSTYPKRRNFPISLQYRIRGKWQVVVRDVTGPNGWVNLFFLPTLKDGSPLRGIVEWRILLPNEKSPSFNIRFG